MAKSSPSFPYVHPSVDSRCMSLPILHAMGSSGSGYKLSNWSPHVGMGVCQAGTRSPLNQNHVRLVGVAFLRSPRGRS